MAPTEVAESVSEEVSTEELAELIEQERSPLTEDGNIVPPMGSTIEVDAEGAGKGMKDGEFSRLGDGSMLASVKVADIHLSADVPQVERKSKKPIKYRKDYTPITVWRRKDGRLELITGQRRLEAARQHEEELIAVRVFDEDATHDARWARLFHAEQNIRYKQATVEQVAYYYREKGLTDLQAEEQGLVARDANGRPMKTLTMGSTIARLAPQAVYEKFMAGEMTAREAYAEATQGGGTSMALDLSKGESEPYTQEELEIIARANDSGTYMKAPNGAKSNLTPKQWAQVRTQAFKSFFGDWETLAIIKAVRAMKATVITPGESLDKAGMKAAFAALGDVTNAFNKRKVRFPSASAGKIRYHKGFDTSTIVGSFGMLFEDAMPAFDLPEIRMEGHKYHSNHERYENYLNKFSVDGETYYIRFTVPIIRNSKPPHNVHSTAISEISVYKEGDSTMTPRNTAGSGNLPFVDTKLADFFASVNEKDVSKVIDENGEPLVVYHGTPATFTVFKPSKDGALGAGIYSTAFEHLAKGPSRGGNIMRLFLNIRNPYEALYPGGIEQDKLITRGYDGVYNPSNQYYVAFAPAQIKSATDNRGTFDSGTPDITMALDLDNGVGAMQLAAGVSAKEEAFQKLLRSIEVAGRQWNAPFKGSHASREKARGSTIGLAMGIYRKLPAGYRVKLEPMLRKAAVLERMIAPVGIEPTSEVPETSVLSIERRGRRLCAANYAGECRRCQATLKHMPQKCRGGQEF